jgi:hypothetical protein
MFGTTRYVMTVAVLATFLGATVLLVDGILQMAERSGAGSLAIMRQRSIPCHCASR